MSKMFLFSSALSIMLLSVLVSILATGESANLKIRKKTAKKVSNRDTWLRQARVDLTVSQFWIATTLAGLLTFCLVTLISKTPLVSVIFAIGSASIPYMFISKKRSNIARELVGAWPDALRDISATVSAGHSLSFALHTLGKVGPASIAPHMSRFGVLERSMGYVAALEIVRDEMHDATTDRIIEVLIVANDRGGKVVKEIIDDLIDATTEDIALADTIATESIEMKINSRAVVIIPWLVLVLLTLSGGIFRDFYRSSAGALIILVGAAMSAVGIAILSRLTRVELEPRVFAENGELLK